MKNKSESNFKNGNTYTHKKYKKIKDVIGYILIFIFIFF